MPRYQVSVYRTIGPLVLAFTGVQLVILFYFRCCCLTPRGSPGAVLDPRRGGGMMGTCPHPEVAVRYTHSKRKKEKKIIQIDFCIKNYYKLVGTSSSCGAVPWACIATFVPPFSTTRLYIWGTHPQGL